ncbi:hypothetical protein MMPV_009482 [Pyropia vietnamensis]
MADERHEDVPPLVGTVPPATPPLTASMAPADPPASPSPTPLTRLDTERRETLTREVARQVRRRGRRRLFQRALLVDVEPLVPKDIDAEVRGAKDLLRFADDPASVVLLDVPDTTSAGVVARLLTEMTARGLLPSDRVAEATDALLGYEPVLGLARPVAPGEDASDAARSRPMVAVAGTTESSSTARHWRRNIQGPSFLVPLASVGGLAGNKVVAGVARLAHAANLGAVNDSLTRWVVIVLGPRAELKGTKTPLELGRSFASLLCDDGFYARAATVRSADAFRSAIRMYFARDLPPALLPLTTGANAAMLPGGEPSPLSLAAPRVSTATVGGVATVATNGKAMYDVESAASSSRSVDGTDASGKWIGRAGDDEMDEGEEDFFQRSGRLGGGLIADIRRRYKPSVYLSDWTDGLRDSASLLKYLSTIVWLYFAILMPTIAFGSLNNDNTAQGGNPKGQIGVIETLISQAVCGVLFAAFAGQPLVIIMTTGPLTVFINVLATWTNALEIDFLPFYAWTGLFTAAILVVLVVTDAFSLMRFCGYFTEEIFAALIAAIFIGEFLKPLIKLADKGPTDVFLLSFVLASCTYLIANTLLSFKRSYLLKPFIRMLLSEFGVPIAIVTMSAINVAFRSSVKVELLEVPDRIGVVTSTGRPWVVPIFDLPAKFIALALVSALLLSALFFLDQNISALLVNRRENRLLKGPGYHLDLLIVALLVAGTSVFGLTWTHAALPHSPLHARALADTEEYEAHGRRHERVVRARETRVTGFVTHVLIGLSILFKDAIGQIPVSVLYGFFLYIGIATLDGNGLWQRVLLWFTQAEKYPPNHVVRRVPLRKIHLYTAVQVFLLVVLWFIKANFYLTDTIFNAGLLFPLVIVAFIPIRLRILPRLFSGAELSAFSNETPADTDTGISV